ncbi:hypothetical protein BKA62DRAFT_720441 [Auriculariales sp. MPI-PUGE-AT-0066]|nr:hypothetical protein BKA62DRAFT_720441 [Auriculariales sp. MPI-PUGE-AT-0066]
MSFRTLLTYTQQAAAAYADKPAFFKPKCSANSPSEWEPISFATFADDLERAAGYWTSFFDTVGIARGAVVGLWLSGFLYDDTVHLFALSGAGYVPQSFSLQNVQAVKALLETNGTKCLIYGPTTANMSLQLPEVMHHLQLYEHPDLPTIRKSTLRLQVPIRASGDDIFAIYHTTGSTGSLPKLVPYTYRFLDAALKKQNYLWETFGGTRTTQMGSVMHIGHLSMLFGSIQNGASMALPYPGRIPYTSDDLIMFHAKGLLDSAIFLGPQLGRYLIECKTNALLREVFTQLQRIMFTGAALSESDQAIARSYSINLMQAYGSSELSGVMCGPEADLMRATPGFSYSFVPLNTQGRTDDITAGRDMICELVVRAGAPDLPHASLLNNNGDFHTGDLFREVQPGAWKLCGRINDWLKMFNGCRCETKSIETDALASCSDIIQSCFVAGEGRITPVLFVELQVDGDDAHRWDRAREIVRRLGPSQALRYPHDSITDAKRVVIVRPKELPRTAKGNIRRAVVEDQYRTIMDAIDTRAT